MNEKEGVTKYTLQYSVAPAIEFAGLADLNAWRKLLYKLGLIGEDPNRYGGVGFGNLSVRVPPFDAPPRARRFLITGTQTGGKPELSASDYSLVTHSDPEANHLIAEGPVAPSSEALTHGMVYQLDQHVRVVMHVHSPDIWRHADALGIAVTSRHAAYGTPEMAAEIRQILQTGAARGNILVMGGHEDGVISFGETAAQAGRALCDWLLRAFKPAHE